MKKAIIVTLVCVNIVLAGALITVNLQPTTAQTMTITSKSNYAATSCIVGDNYEAVLILDSASQKLAAFRLSQDGGSLVPYTPIDLKKEFR